MKGRRVLVSGSAGGIGRAVSERLLAGGAAVLGVDRVLAEGLETHQLAADLSTAEGNRAAVDEALQRLGGLDAVVACAGFQHISPVADFPEDRWDALLAVMLTSPFLLAKYSWRALSGSGAGRFLAIASAHGLVASPYKAGYVAAKHGVVGLVKVLALEGAGCGISAVALCPGFVRTPLVEGQLATQAEAYGVPEEEVLETVLLAPQAVKRMLEPAEVAEVVAFLLGPAGQGFTGAALPLDLGWTAR
jgi:3-hydroxybutyrate dehydrogenase